MRMRCEAKTNTTLTSVSQLPLSHYNQKGVKREMERPHGISMRKILFVLTYAAIGVFFAWKAHAQTPLMHCQETDRGTVLCEAGFADGASAAGVPMQVLDDSGAAIAEGVMDIEGQYEFQKPESPFTVRFDAGQGLELNIYDEDIED